MIRSMFHKRMARWLSWQRSSAVSKPPLSIQISLATGGLGTDFVLRDYR